jgi:hypothetical protein
MTLFGRDVLLVGQSFQASKTLTDRLRVWGFRCHFAGNLGTAQQLLNSVRVDVVLSNTHLSDGSGFRLLAALVGRPITAFLCVHVEKGCFWLPALDAGEECLGLPALRPSQFASALQEMAGRLATASPAH